MTTSIKRSDDIRARISAAKTGQARKPFTDATRAKMSSAQKGRKTSPETRAKLSAARQKFVREQVVKGVAADAVQEVVGQCTAPVRVSISAPLDDRRYGPRCGEPITKLAPLWCAQCEARVGAQRLAACTSRFCALKVGG